MIELSLLQQHLRSDPGTEDELVLEYLAQAIDICESYCHRKFYLDNASRQDDSLAALLELDVAAGDRDVALGAANTDVVREAIRTSYNQRFAALMQRVKGVVFDHALRAAVMKQTGYLHRNRQEGVEIPVEVGRILDKYVVVGFLSGWGGS